MQSSTSFAAFWVAFSSASQLQSCRRRLRRTNSSSRCWTAAHTPNTWEGGHRRRGGTRRESVRVSCSPFYTFYAPRLGSRHVWVSLPDSGEPCDAFGKYFPSTSITVAQLACTRVVICIQRLCYPAAHFYWSFAFTPACTKHLHRTAIASPFNKDVAMADIVVARGRAGTQTQSLPPPSLPQLVAEQHVPIPSSDKDTKRLIVVLSNASLETYKASHGVGRNGMKENKYSLLNSDEHIGVMRKMNRDISDARPDITHQVCYQESSTSSSSPTNRCPSVFSPYSTLPSTRLASCRSTSTPRRAFSSRSRPPSAYRVPSNASPASWSNCYTTSASAQLRRRKSF